MHGGHTTWADPGIKSILFHEVIIQRRQNAPVAVSMGKKSPHQLSSSVHSVSIIGHRSPSEAYTKQAYESMSSVHHAARQAHPSLPLTFQSVFHGNLDR
ncbi:hypothetical protein E4U17_002785 [Claviceps sp. LM77 group G4]|nr:hypothetical protein E4U17_002785 [Claviceps sp. LM77 group G4]